MAKSFITFVISVITYVKSSVRFDDLQVFDDKKSSKNNIFYQRMYIAKNIKFLRGTAGLNQTELGERVGKTKEAISTYERGKNEPSIEVLFELARFFDVAVEDMVLRDIEKEGSSDKPAPTSATISDDEVMRLNELMMHRIRELEREIKADNPDLAKKLGIK